MNWMERLNERADLMGKMLETIGAMKTDRSGMHAGISMRTATLRCLSCRETEACREWLAKRESGSGETPDHCPNAALFRSWLDC